MMFSYVVFRIYAFDFPKISIIICLDHHSKLEIFFYDILVGQHTNTFPKQLQELCYMKLGVQCFWVPVSGLVCNQY